MPKVKVLTKGKDSFGSFLSLLLITDDKNYKEKYYGNYHRISRYHTKLKYSRKKLHYYNKLKKECKSFDSLKESKNRRKIGC